MTVWWDELCGQVFDQVNALMEAAHFSPAEFERLGTISTYTTPEAARAAVVAWRSGPGSAIADIWNKHLDFGDYRYRVAPDPKHDEAVAMRIAARHLAAQPQVSDIDLLMARVWQDAAPVFLRTSPRV